MTRVAWPSSDVTSAQLRDYELTEQQLEAALLAKNKGGEMSSRPRYGANYMESSLRTAEMTASGLTARGLFQGDGKKAG